MTAEDRFWAKVDRSGGSAACWPWMAARDHDGYGRFRTNEAGYAAHRFSYYLVHGPIPARLTLDHLCRNRACVNPAHLEAVTNRENILRGITLPAKHHRLTACERGHPLSTDRNGKRYCIECRRMRGRVPVPCPDCGAKVTRSGLTAHRKLPHPLRFPAKSHPGNPGRPRSAPAI